MKIPNKQVFLFVFVCLYLLISSVYLCLTKLVAIIYHAKNELSNAELIS